MGSASLAVQLAHLNNMGTSTIQMDRSAFHWRYARFLRPGDSILRDRIVTIYQIDSTEHSDGDTRMVVTFTDGNQWGTSAAAIIKLFVAEAIIEDCG